jgi:hypothetical protein
MLTVAGIPTTDKPITVHYARLYTLEGYAVQTPAGLIFVDHDAHVYAIPPDQAHALTRLGAVPAVERANVLQALARAGEVCG